MKRWVGQFLSHYGMLLVLAAICIYYSFATVVEQPPDGADAAHRLAVRNGKSRVLLVVRDAPVDVAFVELLEREMRLAGADVAGIVRGEPRDARLQIEKLAGSGKPLDYIATTADCAGWTLWRGMTERFPGIGNPVILVPESRRWPTFLTRQNLLNVANQIAVVAILAAGMTIVVITGGIDLSVGSLIALSAVGTCMLIRDHGGGVNASSLALVLCSAAGIAMCALAGFFCGCLVAAFRVPAFIATLAAMQITSGLAFILAKGGSIYEVPDAYAWLGRGSGPTGIPNAVLLMLGVYVAAHIVMSRTRLGRRIYAVGGNAEAARLSGVHVPSVLILAYTVCGALAGLAGILQASQLKSGAPTYGQMYELYAVAAVVVGGTSLAGGEGRVFGTLIGALIIGVIQNGMNLTGIESYRQKVVLGTVIVGAVILDLLKRRDWSRFWKVLRK